MLSNIAIRAARPSDRKICADVFSRSLASNRNSEPRNVGLREFRELTAGELLLVAADSDRLIGFISVWEPGWFVHHLFVAPEFQSMSAGSHLLDHVVHLAGGHDLSLKCQVKNIGALRFYERHGFRQTESQGVDEFGDWVELRRSTEHYSQE